MGWSEEETRLVQCTQYTTVFIIRFTCRAAAAAEGVTLGAVADRKISFPAPSIATPRAVLPSYIGRDK
jgi:hypothetical protein